MQLEYMKLIVAGSWVSLVCAAGLVGSFNSLRGWTVLVGFALLPPLVMMQRWNHPSPSLSESIQRARR